MYKRYILSIFLLPLSLYAAEPTAPDAQAITACMRANMPNEFAVEDFIITSTAASGSQESIGGHIYYSRENRDGSIGPARAMMRIKHPAPLRDSAYLILETDDYERDGMFVYLPAVSRVRRISGTFADGRLFGTDITYYEFKQFRSAFGDMNPELLGAGQHDGRVVHRIRFTPKTAEDTAYDRADADIDAISCLPLRIGFYTGDTLVKLLTVPVSAIRANGPQWFMDEFRLEDRANRSFSVVKTSGFRTDKDLSDKLFNPISFYRTF